MFAVNPLKVVVVCQPVVGAVVDEVLMAYSADCPVVLGVSVTAATVMLVCVGVPLTTGTDTAAPSPFATALAVTVPLTATGAVAPVTLAAATVAGRVRFTELAL